MPNDVTKILDPLVDAWCERRAFKPLRYILPVYPLPSSTWLTDDCAMILEALKDVRGFCHDILPASERSELTRAMIILQDALEKR
jgi:hypothetical protein